MIENMQKRTNLTWSIKVYKKNNFQDWSKCKLFSFWTFEISTISSLKQFPALFT